MISVLALVVTILVAFVSPIVVWAVARQQIVVAAREAWMRELREQFATIMAHYVTVQIVDSHAMHLDTSDPASKDAMQRLSEISRAAHVIRFLIRERGWHDEKFIGVIDALVRSVGTAGRHEPNMAAFAAEMEAFAVGATAILQRERAEIATDPGVWRVLWTSLGIGAVRWRPWSRFVAWCRRPPPRGDKKARPQI